MWEAKENVVEKSKEVNFIKKEENEELKWKEIKSLSDKIDTMNNRLNTLEEKIEDLDFDDSEYARMSHDLRKRVEKLEEEGKM